MEALPEILELRAEVELLKGFIVTLMLEVQSGFSSVHRDSVQRLYSAFTKEFPDTKRYIPRYTDYKEGTW